MAWIESHTTLRFHKKTFRLSEELKTSRPTVIGLLHCLWWFAIEYRDTGDLGGMPDEEIARAADWTGDAKKFVKALHDCQWMKGYVLVDWDHYAGRLIRERIRKRKSRQQNDARELFEPTEVPLTPSPRLKRTAGESKTFVDLWNKICTDLSAVQQISKARDQKIQKRLAEQPDMDYWAQAFQKINESSFCTGGGGTGWVATFDWIIANDNNVVKVMEGAYDDKKRGKGNGVQSQNQGGGASSFAARETLRRRDEEKKQQESPRGLASRGVLPKDGNEVPVQGREAVKQIL